jgi:cytochrome c biogenesis protein CcdA
MNAVLAYAFTLGLVAAINPCGFPLLPAYLTAFAGDRPGTGWVRQTERGLVAGASVTAGFVLVFGTLGLAVDSGAGLVLGWVPWVMLPLAAAMTVAGVMAVLGRQVRLRLPVPRIGSSRGPLTMAGFGVAYAVASLSCTLPLFLAGVAGSFTRVGFFTGAETFLAYALGMGLLLTVASLAVAYAGASVLRRVVTASRFVPKASGLVLALAGAYLVLYWLDDLVSPASSPAPVRVVEHVQSVLVAWLGGSSRLIGAVLGAGVVIACLALAAASRDRRPSPSANRGPALSAEPPASGQEGSNG